MRVGIDLMGSDQLPHKLFEAVIQSVTAIPSCHFMVIAEKLIIEEIKKVYGSFLSTDSRQSISFIVSGDSILMDELPTQIRRKREASLVLGIKALQENAIDAFISAGNTGALALCAMLTLKTLPGISRPALIADLPTERGPVSVVDVGFNVSCSEKQLLQFAKMGMAYQRLAQNNPVPKVGLLNIGEEAQKGTQTLRNIYKLLEEYSRKPDQAKMRFVGNVEGREVFHGKVDVLVTDGFAGNVFLKTAEGVSSFILSEIHQVFHNEFPHSKQVLERLSRHLDYAEYPGALLSGVNGLVVKVHGSSRPKAFFNAIVGVASRLQQNFMHKFRSEIAIYSDLDL